MSAPLRNAWLGAESQATASEDPETSCVSSSVDGAAALFMPKSEKRALNALLAEITEQRTLLEARQLEAKEQRAVVRRLAKTVESELQRLSSRSTQHHLRSEHSQMKMSKSGDSSRSHKYWPTSSDKSRSGEIGARIDRPQASSYVVAATSDWSTNNNRSDDPSTTEKSVDCSSSYNDVGSTAPYYFTNTDRYSKVLGCHTPLRYAASRRTATATHAVTPIEKGSSKLSTNWSSQRSGSASNRVATPATASTAVPYTPPSRNSPGQTTIDGLKVSGSSGGFFDTSPCSDGNPSWAANQRRGNGTRGVAPYPKTSGRGNAPKSAKLIKMLTGVPSQVLPPIKQYLYCPSTYRSGEGNVEGSSHAPGFAGRVVASNSGPDNHQHVCAEMAPVAVHRGASQQLMNDSTAGLRSSTTLPKAQCSIPNASCTDCGSTAVTFCDNTANAQIPHLPSWPVATTQTVLPVLSETSRRRLRTTTVGSKRRGGALSVESPNFVDSKGASSTERPAVHLSTPNNGSSPKSSMQTSGIQRTSRLKDSEMLFSVSNVVVGATKRTQSMRALRDLGSDPSPCRKLPLAKAARVHSTCAPRQHLSFQLPLVNITSAIDTQDEAQQRSTYKTAAAEGTSSQRCHITKEGVLVAHIGSELASIATNTPVIQSVSSSAHRSPTTHDRPPTHTILPHDLLMTHTSLYEDQSQLLHTGSYHHTGRTANSGRSDSISRVELIGGELPCGECECCHRIATSGRRVVDSARRHKQRRPRQSHIKSTACPPHDDEEQSTASSSAFPVDVCVVVTAGNVLSSSSYDMRRQLCARMRNTGSASELPVAVQSNFKRADANDAPPPLQSPSNHCSASDTAPPAHCGGLHKRDDETLSPGASNTSLPEGVHDWSTVDVTPLSRDDAHQLLRKEDSPRRHYYSRYKRYSPRNISRLYTASSGTTTITNLLVAEQIGANLVDTAVSEEGSLRAAVNLLRDAQPDGSDVCGDASRVLDGGSMPPADNEGRAATTPPGEVENDLFQRGEKLFKNYVLDRYTSFDSRSIGSLLCAHESSDLVCMETQSEPATCRCNVVYCDKGFAGRASISATTEIDYSTQSASAGSAQCDLQSHTDISWTTGDIVNSTEGTRAIDAVIASAIDGGVGDGDSPHGMDLTSLQQHNDNHSNATDTDDENRDAANHSMQPAQDMGATAGTPALATCTSAGTPASEMSGGESARGGDASPCLVGGGEDAQLQGEATCEVMTSLVTWKDCHEENTAELPKRTTQSREGDQGKSGGNGETKNTQEGSSAGVGAEVSIASLNVRLLREDLSANSRVEVEVGGPNNAAAPT